MLLNNHCSDIELVQLSQNRIEKGNNRPPPIVDSKKAFSFALSIGNKSLFFYIELTKNKLTYSSLQWSIKKEICEFNESKYVQSPQWQQWVILP